MASLARKKIPIYRPGSEPSEERVEYLLNEFTEKILERRQNLKLGVKELFRKHDLDNSGTLENHEVLRALNDFLPGFDAMEYQSISRKLDIDNSGSVDIAEVSQMLHDLHNGDTLPCPPKEAAQWGNQYFDPRPKPPVFQDTITKGGKTNKAAQGRKQSRYGATGGHAFKADEGNADKNSVVGSDFSFHESIRKSFWKGETMERHYRFLHKIKQSLMERLKHKYAEMRGTDRLFINKEVLMERFCKKELTRLFEHGGNNDVEVDVEDPRIRRVKFEKFRAVLKDFRTPGQPFLTWNDIRDLHALCDNGDMQTFFQVLFAKPDQEFTASGADAEARIRATRDVPGLEYPATRTTVYPPAGWHEDKKKLVRRSSTVPSMALQLEYVHGYNCEAHGTNLYTFIDKNTQTSRLIYAAAGLVVIHDPATKKQRYFMDHSDDVVALCIDSTGSLCASGQVASIDENGKARPPLVYVWDIETLAVLRTIDAATSKANIQRSITALCFSDDSSLLMLIGADDKHVVTVFDLKEGGAERLADSPGQVGPPIQIHTLVAAPRIVSTAFCASLMFVSAGESSHIKFWLWKPNETEPLFITKGKFLKVSAPRLLMSVCFMPKDDVVYVGSGDGRVLIFRYPGECFAAQQVHSSEATIRTLCAQKDGKHLWSGGSDHMLYQSFVKDGKIVKLRSYDFSPEGQGHMEIITRAEESDDFSNLAGSTRSDKMKNTQKSHRSKGSVHQSAAMKSVNAIKNTGGGERTGANIRDIRKKDLNELKVVVRDMVMVSQKNNKIEEEIGLVVATDAGSFWYVDWQRNIVEEIYYCHAGSPTLDRTMGGVQGVAPHPSKNTVFATCGEDMIMAVWDASKRMRLRTGRLAESAISIAYSPQEGDHLAVGFHGGYLGIYDSTTFVRVAWHHRTSGDIQVLKYSPNGRQLATGSRENVIDLFDVKNKESPYHHRKRLIGHSSGVLCLDWSADSKLLQSNCGAYEILYWDAIKGRNLRACKDSTESDTIWETWTCTLGFPVMGIWQSGWSRNDVNAVSRSRDMKLLVFGDDYGSVNLVNAPCIIKHAPRRSYSGHSSHVDDITFLKDDQRVISCGGRDKVLLQYRVVSAGDLDPGTNLLLHQDTKGRLKTTNYGGGFANTERMAAITELGNKQSKVTARGGGGGGGGGSDDSDLSEEEYDEDYVVGGCEGKRWGEEIVLPNKGIVKPAWTTVFSKEEELGFEKKGHQKTQPTKDMAWSKQRTKTQGTSNDSDDGSRNSNHHNRKSLSGGGGRRSGSAGGDSVGTRSQR